MTVQSVGSTGGVYKGLGRNRREPTTRARQQFLAEDQGWQQSIPITTDFGSLNRSSNTRWPRGGGAIGPAVTSFRVVPSRSESFRVPAAEGFAEPDPATRTRSGAPWSAQAGDDAPPRRRQKAAERRLLPSSIFLSLSLSLSPKGGETPLPAGQNPLVPALVPCPRPRPGSKIFPAATLPQLLVCDFAAPQCGDFLATVNQWYKKL